jgi:hypothetical protein
MEEEISNHREPAMIVPALVDTFLPGVTGGPPITMRSEGASPE